MTDDKRIIDLGPSRNEAGEIVYTKKKPSNPPKDFSGLFIRVAGVALGVAIFLLLLFFFVYVILPIIAILVLWIVLRNIFRPRR